MNTRSLYPQLARQLTGTVFLLCFFAVIPVPGQAPAASKATPVLPKVVLIGDSIRLGYAPVVAQRLAGMATVISPAPNGGDSSNVLRNLEEWVIREKPDVVHFNAGLHDLKLSKQTGKHQVEIDAYEANLRGIISHLRKNTDAALLFANTTPILDDRHAKRKADFDRLEADVERYNAVAQAVMKEAQVPVHDLHGLVQKGGADNWIGPDGTHYVPEGYQRLGEAVADAVLRQLVIRRYQPLPVPDSGPEAAAAYRKAETEGDALVPAGYRNMKCGELRVPESAEAWKKQRPDIRRIVLESLGDLPQRPAPSRTRLVSRELHPEFVLERVVIDNGVDGEISALLLLPVALKRPAPAILWLHSSTPDKNQIIIPNTNGGAEPLGTSFVRAGYVVLSPDAYWHGDRMGTGPAGAAETLRQEQESLFKLHLWMGRTLWGMFVRDDQIALDYLADRPEVDRSRIGATGMSMGSTRAWWLAAVDERIAAVVGVACLTRYQNLIAHGQLRQHGIYYFTYGLLKHFDSEGVLALIAPRPYLALTGDLDAGSPADGIKVLEEKVGRIYALLNAADRFKSILYPEVGHAYTPEMRAETLAWFARWLGPEKK
jgi:lysophospholipase L1-like esterase/dienelactone hydrolase